jgi:hypothetical protein
MIIGGKMLYFGSKQDSTIKRSDIDEIFRITSEFCKKIAVLPIEGSFAVIRFEGMNLDFGYIIGDFKKATSPKYLNVLNNCKGYSEKLMKHCDVFCNIQKRHRGLTSEVTKTNHNDLPLKLVIVGTEGAVFQDTASHVLSSIIRLHSENKNNQIRAGD